MRDSEYYAGLMPALSIKYKIILCIQYSLVEYYPYELVLYNMHKLTSFFVVCILRARRLVVVNLAAGCAHARDIYLTENNIILL